MFLQHRSSGTPEHPDSSQQSRSQCEQYHGRALPTMASTSTEELPLAPSRSASHVSARQPHARCARRRPTQESPGNPFPALLPHHSSLIAHGFLFAYGCASRSACSTHAHTKASESLAGKRPSWPAVSTGRRDWWCSRRGVDLARRCEDKFEVAAEIVGRSSTFAVHLAVAALERNHLIGPKVAERFNPPIDPAH